ncbi:hypothetical protein FB550_10649 [Neobacillus bataviensis]|jgi:hypothetical protein|uniref:Uncharacterized protein n=1 Tax=Neobacillus bataviensis TaxID=220685 RepID=A0A561DC83_9BACI|nr:MULTISPECIES: hypothetical protein [Bacillaceae]TWE00997.1 hypothetical protein FB550_10649 [Neobacillus bataviensis]
MNKEIVRYDGKLFMVIYKYSSGYWEIREKDSKFNVQLVHESEVQAVEETVTF